MTELAIHIGPPKAGSTSIQQFLQINESALLDAGIYTDQHRSRELLGAAFRSGMTVWEQREFGERAPAGLKQRHLDELERRLRGAQASNPRLVVFSAEGLFSGDRLDLLRDLLQRFRFSRIRFICYLRRQDRWAVSVLKNRVRNKNQKNLDKIKNRRYAPRLLQFKQLFPDAEFYIRPFVDSDLVEYDLIEDFAAAAGIADRVDVSALAKPERVNQKWPAAALELMSAINAYGLDDPKRRQRIARVIDSCEGYADFSISRDQAIAIAGSRQAIADNETVLANFFSDRQRLFNENFDDYPEAGADAGDDDLKALAAEVIVKMTQAEPAGRNGLLQLLRGKLKAWRRSRLGRTFARR